MKSINKKQKVLDKKRYGGAIPMDLRKAFNAINLDLLIAKSHVSGFSA